jgi:hypothetical protein
MSEINSATDLMVTVISKHSVTVYVSKMRGKPVNVMNFAKSFSELNCPLLNGIFILSKTVTH